MKPVARSRTTRAGFRREGQRARFLTYRSLQMCVEDGKQAACAIKTLVSTKEQS
jgi:hypothetical protein